MPILFTCTCGKQLRVKDELAGKRVKCPVCGEKQLVEATGPAAPVQQTRPRPDRGAGEDEAPRGKKQAQKAGGISPAVWLAIGGGAVLVVVAVVAVVLLSRSGKEAPVAKGPPTGLGARPPGQPSPAPEVAVTADQLAREFRADSQAAAKKYGDKRLLVEGQLEDASTGDGAYDFTVQGVPDPKQPVSSGALHCSVAPGSWEKVAALTPGQSFKFRAQNVSMTAGLLWLENCQFVEAGPDPAIPVAPAQLTRDYATDPKSADRKYKGKYLIVEGVVADLSQGSEPAVVLEGSGENAANPRRVQVTFTPLRAREAAGVKKGAKVKFKAKCWYGMRWTPDEGRTLSLSGYRKLPS